ncbi:MAG TPA: phosphoenolpyruvate synthase [Marinilabiliales bacterium]|jgi:CheY-like chemotaxis protein|nr:MAG: phosphoenolpyruvate synthase [Bacteroidetes bacterium GWA2_40_14]OFX59138.1 MAG: phosphoenolpyruvate synthase [Bacteroidetes bacterium GWC2_40_13]OFX74828.1 MAG: phosphoenolpyruvate synthase [Bacteroidetes bacterium GWD2_40_43]OFX93371.1 MAG: phosphoenolpyruvate synthase [Bacteroidetes bacterium GWE2_40_63]OFY18384.1 MAG: phosphoenolpyruvate synthase [Bacteroidetes bacterium GWF2_40_13]OFZ30784.1 MAG: phosphoenolpyruvate synthase [Bacteroidetes bacterium RIFOXYC2_FULL_40_12]HAM97177.1
MPIYKDYLQTKKYYINETAFKMLMQKRIYKILIVCSNYDFYMLEEDGRIDEQIFDEYVSLNLRFPPAFVHASTSEKTFRVLKNGDIDLIISMLSIDDTDAFGLAKKVKQEYPRIPFVVLTHFSREVRMRMAREDLSAIDYVFSWLGEAEILLAIIKLIEDKMNARNDIEIVGVQAILLVEDNIRFYSSYLPTMYKIILQQSQDFKQEGANEYQQMLRKRGRPKIILATNYNDAIAYYEKYKQNILGVITDIRYKRDGVDDPEAGFKLYQHIRADNEHLPVLMQSSEIHNKKIAEKMGASFLSKDSGKLNKELSQYINRYFAFGDFVFRLPDRSVVGRASNLKQLQHLVLTVPDESLNYHSAKNDFSRWLNARALFSLGSIFRTADVADFKDTDEVRQYMYSEISKYRLNRGRGIITTFSDKNFDRYCIFSRVGDGSMGGKARGLAFIDSLIKKHQILYQFENVVITIPRTMVLSTSVFDEFMEKNHLYSIALSQADDVEILEAFNRAQLPDHILSVLHAFLDVNATPLAIRSSSVLEDSHYQPFAGIYSTYMIPYIDYRDQMIAMLCQAIKSVYASTFFHNSKAYMKATKNLIDEEKMGIIIQEVCGSAYGDRFYPTLSGVGRSINFYPIAPEKHEEGIANIALGLGKQIVEGGRSLRFSPKYPKKILQLSDANMALRDTQKFFYSLDLNTEAFKLSTNDGINLVKLKVQEADKDHSISQIASTYDYQDNLLRDGVNYPGKKVITFANVLKNDSFPLAEIIDTLLRIGAAEMNNPVEIEFAANLNVKPGEPRIFNFLQIRPIVENEETIDIDFAQEDKNDWLIYCETALGNGIIQDVHDIIYVKPETFNASNNPKLVPTLENINQSFVDSETNYILVGPGRWGSSDPWLGIPVKWSQISQARVIIEAGLKDYRIDPSQGTHFFQNLTSFRVGYFTINPFINDGYYDLDFLKDKQAAYEDEFIKHIRFNNCLEIKIDGKKNKGLIKKPKA